MEILMFIREMNRFGEDKKREWNSSYCFSTQKKGVSRNVSRDDRDDINA